MTRRHLSVGSEGTSASDQRLLRRREQRWPGPGASIPSSIGPLGWSAVMWHDNLIFSEYFHGDNGAVIGAFHRTGWTGLMPT